ncbi:uncharacterized protein LOC135379127 [Ornithodoros turicata]|uniref:uncharacterized protein LOC135379127 n=1 Tax=Ornithodoros turicata TaxID=34597 RepID=UPI003138D382
MYAYVRYIEDEVKAILPVSLIRSFNPKSCEDYDRSTVRKAFWRSKNGDVMNYYDAKVLLLGIGLVPRLTDGKAARRAKVNSRTPRPFLGRSCAKSTPTRPNLDIAGSEVTLEDGITIRTEKLEWVLGATKDSLFCRDMARTLWSTEELSERSVTGEACRRLAKDGVQGKKRLTPKKVDALGNAYWEYLKRNRDTDQSGEERFGTMTTHLRNLLSDINRKK